LWVVQYLQAYVVVVKQVDSTKAVAGLVANTLVYPSARE